MRAMKLGIPAGLNRLALGTAESSPVGAGQVRVRLHASSLNYHDYLVVTGVLPAPDGRIPMCDGAGEVVEVGEDVSEFAIGDCGVSTRSVRPSRGSANPPARGPRKDHVAWPPFASAAMLTSAMAPRAMTS